MKKLPRFREMADAFVYLPVFSADPLLFAIERELFNLVISGAPAEKIDAVAAEYLLALPDPASDETVIDEPCPCGYCGSKSGSDEYGYCITCGGC